MPTPPVPDDLAGALRSRGLRMTPQRRDVLDAVYRLGHATPEQIAAEVREVDLTTVYRTLALLEELHLLAHTHFGHGAPSYRRAGDGHMHVVCHWCGSVVDTAPDLADGLAARLHAELGFTLDIAHFTVFGQCAQCAAASDGPVAPESPARSEQGAHVHA